MIKIHLGCGNRKLPHPWVNCDIARYCEPDFLFDFGEDDWPFANHTADEILAKQCLEHSRGLLHVMTEAYRVLIPGGKFHIEVPHPRSDFFIGDPTHVMPITHDALNLFSRELCLESQAKGLANTPLALHLEVDFRIVTHCWHINPRWKSWLLTDDMKIKDEKTFRHCVNSYNNVIETLEFVLEKV